MNNNHEILKPYRDTRWTVYFESSFMILHSCQMYPPDAWNDKNVIIQELLATDRQRVDEKQKVSGKIA